jgi:hypothetical protein
MGVFLGLCNWSKAKTVFLLFGEYLIFLELYQEATAKGKENLIILDNIGLFLIENEILNNIGP